MQAIPPQPPSEGNITQATIDLRSDTVTRPTAEMRRAMFEATVGDDVFGDDPTVNRLEALAAQTFGKAAALFVPSGTMGNQIAIRVHTRPGDEVITEASGHTYCAEQGGAAALSGVQIHPVKGENGVLTPQAVAAAIRPRERYHTPQTRLLIVENTHNMAGGRITSVERLQALRELTAARGIALHIDGARLFNAAVASGTPVSAFARQADSVMFCLSKGLGAPIGSMLVGEADWIDEARRARKLFGGGMRQVGIIAAAGIVALETMVERLAEDHANARMLGEGLAKLAHLEVDVSHIETNILFVGVRDCTAERLVQRMQAAGILATVMGPRIRLVTHKDVSRQDIARALSLMPSIIEDTVSAAQEG